MKENAGAAEILLTPEEVKKIDDMLASDQLPSLSVLRVVRGVF